MITTEDKKKEILNYLEKNYNVDKWNLSKNKIYKKFIDEEFDREDIKNILKNLENEGRINEFDLDFSILVPRKFYKDIKLEIKHSIRFFPKIIVYAIGWYILIFLISIIYRDKLYKIGNSNLNDSSMIFVATIGFFGSLIIGILFEKSFNFIQSKVPLILEHKNLILSIILIFIILSIALGLFSFFLKLEIQMAHLISILVASIGTGFVLEKYLNNSRN